MTAHAVTGLGVTAPDPAPLSDWIGRPLLGAGLRVFCFPYAGGGASVFREWPRELVPRVEIFPVQLPGRESRWREPAVPALAGLIRQLADIMRAAAKVPFVLFGHSMGALIAFELARELRRRDVRGLAHLFVSGARAPQMPDRHPPIHDLPDLELLHELGTLNGIPEAILRHDELHQLLLPALRADLTLCETYEYHPEPPLPCPISAYGGTEDPRVCAEEVQGWSVHTASEFRERFFPGAHFFINTARDAVLEALAEEARHILAHIAEPR